MQGASEWARLRARLVKRMVGGAYCQQGASNVRKGFDQGSGAAVRWDGQAGAHCKNPQAGGGFSGGREVCAGKFSGALPRSVCHPRGGWALGSRPAACARRSDSLTVSPNSSPHSTTSFLRRSLPYSPRRTSCKFSVSVRPASRAALIRRCFLAKLMFQARRLSQMEVDWQLAGRCLGGRRRGKPAATRREDGDVRSLLHGADEFFGEDLRFFGEVAGAGPVTGFGGFASVFEEAFDLGDQVGLRRVQLLVARGGKIFLRNVQALIGFLLRGGKFLFGELRGNGGGFGPLFGIGGGSSSSGGGRRIHLWPR